MALRSRFPWFVALLGAAGSPLVAQVAFEGRSVAGASPVERLTPQAFELVPLPLDGPPPVHQPGEPYTLVSADMERDGDLDLLINWHNFGPLELWENQGGRFVLRNAPGADRSGIFDNRGIPYLFADADEQLAAIEADGRPGLWVWHDVDREFGSWRFFARRETAGVALEIELTANQPIVDVEGLGEVEMVLLDPQRLLVCLEDAHLGRTFGVRVEKISTQLVVRQSDPALEVYAGRERVATGTGELELWKHDPHGIGWLPSRGGPEPELYVSRGGLMGTLLPPNDPKFDFAYELRPSPAGIYAFSPERLFERSYGRTRQVQWVDIDRDGTNELYLGNRRSRNTLNVYDPDSGTYRDRAADWNVDLLHGEAFAWLDIDDDGDEDIVFLGVDGLRARTNEGTGFAGADPEELGLVFEGVALGDGTNLERPHFLVADFDNDGRSDLLVTTVGELLRLQLFLRRGEGFVNVTAAAGLIHHFDAAAVTTLDAENDGDLDILSVGGHVTLFRNDGDATFVPTAFELDLLPNERFGIVGATDVDGDGREDAVLVSQRRLLARNRAQNRNRFLRVDLTAGERLPIGALVSAHYGDGSVQVQRFGSANNPKFSQALTPLHFGVPSRTSLDAISVRWPATGHVTVHPVEEDDLDTTLRF